MPQIHAEICEEMLGSEEAAPDWSDFGEDEGGEQPQRSLAEELRDRKLHQEEVAKWDKVWMDRARKQDWN